MAKRDDAYENYGRFLQAAIRAYWDASSGRRVNFLALLLATRESWKVAWGGLTSVETGKKVLKGAAGAAAVAVLLRVFLGGPLGLLLTAGSIASLVAVYVKHHDRIWARVGHYREVIESYETRFDKISDDYAAGRVDRDQRNLMMDGLMARFLDTLNEEFEEDEEFDEDEEDAELELDTDSFASHVIRKRDDED